MIDILLWGAGVYFFWTVSTLLVGVVVWAGISIANQPHEPIDDFWR